MIRSVVCSKDGVLRLMDPEDSVELKPSTERELHGLRLDPGRVLLVWRPSVTPLVYLVEGRNSGTGRWSSLDLLQAVGRLCTGPPAEKSNRAPPSPSETRWSRLRARLRLPESPPSKG